MTINVLGNDFDPDGSVDPNTVVIVTAPASGSAWSTERHDHLHPGAALGNNTFTYTVEDNLGAVSNVATVSVFVNTPPIAANDSAQALGHGRDDQRARQR